MDMLIAALAGTIVVLLALFLLGLSHFYRTITHHHLHGKKTWAQELEHFVGQ
ncbi:hypothetical protein KSF73_06685 [Burkholderiaceae bacterium DAT-1]|nr:hypothetical protein [Burkholderiaceae bacterium DAT-1]